MTVAFRSAKSPREHRIESTRCTRSLLITPNQRYFPARRYLRGKHRHETDATMSPGKLLFTRDQRANHGYHIKGPGSDNGSTACRKIAPRTRGIVFRAKVIRFESCRGKLAGARSELLKFWPSRVGHRDVFPYLYGPTSSETERKILGSGVARGAKAISTCFQYLVSLTPAEIMSARLGWLIDDSLNVAVVQSYGCAYR